MKRFFILLALSAAILSSCANRQRDKTICSDGSSDFVNVSDVIPDVILEMRYCTSFNFIGEPFPETYFDFPINSASLKR